MNRPLIGLIPLYDDEKESLWMLPGYMDGIVSAGGTPLMLPLTEDEDMLGQMTELCDGFLLTGGHDVSPALYGETPIEACGACCPARDAMEKKLLALALERDMPVLGICRGIQFLNAALGGTLYQDLPQQRPSRIEHHQKPPYDIPVHKVTIVEKTPLAELLQVPVLAVNSYHHQAVKELSPQLTAMAYSEDGLVEAVYMKEKPFVWGVQWHPEFSWKTEESSRKILEQFVKAAKK
ncbi:gamma-glutamyl-gamma-aminobutyrate hydrolase family protein [Marvinbryantia formatexigens]|uniref:gamma-glutamyl-gamma-aminobutyrate hydrolase family protein n=2 Tax=Marvinbryantia formatexigens TaxID=168384 RepID=UPI0009427C59|nr:gamma-glutamyl-gamma-aminobutyrate hydrolase family protein [Marvinbryantia formatexigens]UWO24333.1 gamma-glutamyl-gamma-aminobutyrate hydrolase family protein [Marvinbryantia formatexigens DSM 14469]